MRLKLRRGIGVISMRLKLRRGIGNINEIKTKERDR